MKYLIVYYIIGIVYYFDILIKDIKYILKNKVNILNIIKFILSYIIICTFSIFFIFIDFIDFLKKND